MTHPRRYPTLLFISLLATFVVGGCGLGGESPSSDRDDGGAGGTAAEPAFPDADHVATSAEDGDSSDEGDAEGVPDAVLANVGRDVIYTSTVTLAVEQTDSVRTQIVGLTEGAGGYVFNQNATFDEDATAVITVKIPPPGLDAFLDQVGELGDVRELTTSADDVTGQVADLDSRIASATRSVERVRSFLDEATDVVQLSTVEGELTRRETELERLVAQRKQLGARVEMATVTVTLRPEAEVVAAADDGWEVPGFVAAFGAAIDALATAGRFALAAVGFLVPLAAVAVLLAAPVWLVRRRAAHS